MKGKKKRSDAVVGVLGSSSPFKYPSVSKKFLLVAVVVIVAIAVIGAGSWEAYHHYNQPQPIPTSKDAALNSLYKKLAATKDESQKAALEVQIAQRLQYLINYQQAITYYQKALVYYKKVNDKSKATNVQLGIDFCQAQIKAASFVKDNQSYYNRGKQTGVKAYPVRTE
jgi:hypothetical protein